MSAKNYLIKAVEYDAAGRRLEALKLYEDGIRELLQLCKNETDAQKKQYLQTKAKEYIERAEMLKKFIEKSSNLGTVVDQIHIIDGATGYSYKRLFGKYLSNEVFEITIEEPYFREKYQFFNLIRFLELVVKKCCNLKYVQVKTSKDPKANNSQTASFLNIQKNLKQRSIHLEFVFSEHIHDRQIILNNGYIIKIGRGLHFYKACEKDALGQFDLDFRECRETNVDILKS